MSSIFSIDARIFIVSITCFAVVNVVKIILHGEFVKKASIFIIDHSPIVCGLNFT